MEKKSIQKKIGDSLLTKLAMFILALSPILSIYKLIGPFSFSSFLAILIFITAFQFKRKQLALTLPFFILWGYVSINFLMCTATISLSSILPGGFNFFFFAVSVLAYGAFFDFDLLKRYTRYIFLIASVLFLIQFFLQIGTGTRVSFFIHLSDRLNYGDLTYHQIVQSQLSGERFCSIFLEPAYFAEYGILTLVLELFLDESKDKIVTPLALFYGTIIIMSRSGVGLISLVVLMVLKLIQFGILNKKKNYFVYTFLLLPFLYYGVNYYLQSELGSAMMERSSEITDSEQSSGFSRVLQASLVYDNLELSDKVFGLGEVFVSDLHDKGVFFNGVFSILTSLGAVGFLLYLWFFYSGAKKYPPVLCLCITFLVISAMEWTYLKPIMIITAASVLHYSRNKIKIRKKNENSSNISIANTSR